MGARGGRSRSEATGRTPGRLKEYSCAVPMMRWSRTRTSMSRGDSVSRLVMGSSAGLRLLPPETVSHRTRQRSLDAQRLL